MNYQKTFEIVVKDISIISAVKYLKQFYFYMLDIDKYIYLVRQIFINRKYDTECIDLYQICLVFKCFFIVIKLDYDSAEIFSI